MLNINNNFVLRQIESTDDASKFSLGNASFTPLKIFLQKNAFDFHQYEIAKTFVFVNPEYSANRIWGYITLMTSEVCLDKHQRPVETSAASKYNSYPAAKIARLAIDKALHKRGYGKKLLDWGINHIRLSVMPHIGCRFLVVDSKRESISFYQKNGFVFFNTNTNQTDEYPMMYLDLYRPSPYVKQNELTDNSSEIVSV